MVSATRVETPVKEVASAVTVLTRTDLDRSGRSTVLEAIQDSLGTTAVRNGGPGGSSSIFLRGANSEHVLILLDGVTLNDPINPSRSYDLAHLSLDNIERIEILRGPQSTLYGSDALAGVVNIISRRGAGKPSIALETSGGSYGTLRSSASAAGSAGRLAYSFGLSQALDPRPVGRFRGLHRQLRSRTDTAIFPCPAAWAGRSRPRPKPASSCGPSRPARTSTASAARAGTIPTAGRITGPA